MKHTVHLLLCMLVFIMPYRLCAQNIVVNPDFESYNNCPTTNSNIAYTPTYIDFPSVWHWSNPLKQASPDYFNTCAPVATGSGIPQNTFGHQLARSGQGYAGIIAWEGKYQNGNLVSQYSEYLETKLSQTMKQGERYCVSFYVNQAVSTSLPFNFVAINEIGIHFATAQVSVSTGYTLNLSYDIVNPSSNYLSDTSKWVKVSGIYSAKGGEEWLVLGRFDNGNAPGQRLVYPATADPNYSYRSYLYIDDVSVVKLGVKDTLTATFDSSYCDKAMLPMTLKSRGSDGTYQWSTGASDDRILVTQPGTYTCIANANCQTYIDTFIVKYNPLQDLNLPAQLINCTDSSVTIKTDFKYEDYIWSTGDTTDSITVNKTGVYALTVTNKCGISHTDSVHVYIQPPTPTPGVVTDTTVCQLIEDVKIAVQGQNLMWYTHSNSFIGSPLQPPIVTKELGDYHLFVTQTIGKCESEKVPVNIKVKYTPHEELQDMEKMCVGAARIIGKNIDGLEYKWTSGQINCCITPKYDGRYIVSMKNECGTYRDTVNVAFSPCDDCIAIPNAFTPNNDGRNDKFAPIIKCPVSDFILRVYNRWGEVVYESNDVNKGWSGSYKGILVDLGSYVYRLEYRSNNTNQVKTASGTVLVLY